MATTRTHRSYVYCVGEPLVATRDPALFERALRGSNPVSRAPSEFTAQELLDNSFPKEQPVIPVFTKQADAETFAQRYKETHGHVCPVFKIKADLEALVEEKHEGDLTYYPVPSGKVLDKVSAVIRGQQIELQSDIRRIYEKIWTDTEGTFDTKFAAMFEIYKKHRWFGFAPKHIGVAIAFQDSLGGAKFDSEAIAALIRRQRGGIESENHCSEMFRVLQDSLVAEVHAPSAKDVVAKLGLKR